MLTINNSVCTYYYSRLDGRNLTGDYMTELPYGLTILPVIGNNLKCFLFKYLLK